MKIKISNLQLIEGRPICPYCGVGCQLTYNIKEDKIISVSGRPGPANKSRLCVKGRYGFDYISSPERITKPLIRLDGSKKQKMQNLMYLIFYQIFVKHHGTKLCHLLVRKY